MHVVCFYTSVPHLNACHTPYFKCITEIYWHTTLEKMYLSQGEGKKKSVPNGAKIMTQSLICWMRMHIELGIWGSKVQGWEIKIIPNCMFPKHRLLLFLFQLSSSTWLTNKCTVELRRRGWGKPWDGVAADAWDILYKTEQALLLTRVINKT